MNPETERRGDYGRKGKTYGVRFGVFPPVESKYLLFGFEEMGIEIQEILG